VSESQVWERLLLAEMVADDQPLLVGGTRRHRAPPWLQGGSELQV